MKRILKVIDNYFEEYVCIVLFSLLIFLVGAQIFSRFIFDLPLAWTEELSRFTFIWLVYFSISLAAKYNRHLKIEVGQKFLQKRFGEKAHYLSDLCWLAFNVYMIFNGSKMVFSLLGSIQQSPITRINMGLIYIIIPIGFTLMSIRIIQNMLKSYSSSKTKVETKESALKGVVNKNSYNPEFANNSLKKEVK